MEMTAVEAQIVAQVYREVRGLFAGFDDLAHGWLHVSRVYKVALYIAGREGADPFVVGLGALLHDLGRLSPDESMHHAERSEMLAAELLAAYPIDSEKKSEILHAIAAHSYSRGVEARTLEARVVRDADRIDGLGAIGIMRWAITGTIRRTSQTQSYDPDDPFDERHAPDDKKYMLDHFFTKLLKLEDSMVTETGRLLAEHRTAFIRAYLDEFREELEV